MHINDFIAQHRSRLVDFLEDFMHQHKMKDPADKNIDFYERLREFMISGKMLRGLFVLLFVEMYSGEKNNQTLSQDALKVAAAMEINQTALLIHDDIMDNDDMRRGKMSMHMQFQREAQKYDIENPDHFGKSMALNMGNLCYFLSYELLSSLESDPSTTVQALQYFSQHMQDCSYGQFLDFEYAQNRKIEPSYESIMNMYSLKTGSYSLQIPFMLGAIVGGASEKDKKLIEESAHDLGVIFQMKDDELGLFGDSEKIGKPAGSDIVENKKTVYRKMLFEKLDDEELEDVMGIFGKSGITKSEIQTVRGLLDKYGIREHFQSDINILSEQAKEKVDKLDISDDYKELLKEFIHYNAQRST